MEDKKSFSIPPLTQEQMDILKEDLLDNERLELCQSLRKVIHDIGIFYEHNMNMNDPENQKELSRLMSEFFEVCNKIDKKNKK